MLERCPIPPHLCFDPFSATVQGVLVTLKTSGPGYGTWCLETEVPFPGHTQELIKAFASQVELSIEKDEWVGKSPSQNFNVSVWTMYS